MPFVNGKVLDGPTGEPVEAKVHILDPGGRPVFPESSLLKVGPGLPGFCTHGEFVVELPSGYATFLVERGTEYEPCEITVQVRPGLPQEIEFRLQRWTNLPQQGWYPGNTHIHYDQMESRADERLWLDPRVHNLQVSVISILERRNLPYASNKYPVGLLTDFTSAHHTVDCGEENRHNSTPFEIGYGHVIFLNLASKVLPVSRGVLVDDIDPDYPPLCFACNEAHKQGGLAIWCHNGAGMEAPVAAALGKLDAFNLFDPYWVLPEEYSLWYHMMNCGIHLPASTGSDWFICSNNRVYVQLEGPFTYQAWLRGLQQGRSFITNGPALLLEVNGEPVGHKVYTEAGKPCQVEVRWHSHHALSNVEVIWNGEAIRAYKPEEEARSGQTRFDFKPDRDGWLAARASSVVRDSFYQPLFAHTSPVWFHTGISSTARAASARFFVQALERSIEWVNERGRFDTRQQKREVLNLFRAGQSAYRSML